MQTERLIELLDAQRNEAAIRAGLARDSPDWTESSARLDALNDQIMRGDAPASTPRHTIGDGLHLELDSQPAEDVPFRRAVIDAARQALVAVNRERRSRTPDRRTSSEERIGQTAELIRRLQTVVRGRFPTAVVCAGPPVPERGTIVLRAIRDGRVA